MYERNYGGIIWTNHALDRLRERGIKQGDAWSVWNRPEQSRYSNTKGAWIYYKTFNKERIEVVAKKNEKDEWLILSVWSKNVNHKKTEPSRNVSLLTRLINLFRVKHVQ